MVRLTGSLLKYIPDWYNLKRSPSSFFRKQNSLYMTRFNKGISWSEYRNSNNRYEYHLKGEGYYAELRSQHRRDINRSRIAAACEEHNYRYSYLMSTLPKIDINLNLYSLARLAIYEPQTFKSLIDISREATRDKLEGANFTQDGLDMREDMPREFTPATQ